MMKTLIMNMPIVKTIKPGAKAKAQASVEALFCVIMALTVFSFLAIAVASRSEESDYARDYVDKNDACQDFANMITAAYASGDGFSTHLSLEKYNISVSRAQRGLSVIRGQETEVECSIPVNRVSNSTASFHTEFIVVPGVVCVENANGTVVVRNV